MQSRRQFIATTTAGASLVAAGMAGGIPEAQASGKRHGEIVRVTSDKLIGKRGRPVQETANQMLDLAMTTYMGKKKVADCWSALFTKDDKVVIKINCLGKPKMSTNPEVVKAIIAGLKAAGVPEGNIVVYDHFGGHMRQSRYRLTKKKGAVRYHGRDKKKGFEKKDRKHASGKTRLATVMLWATKIINVPVIKNHSLAGVTGALKNISHGCVINPQRHHRKNCDPHIANIYNIPELRDRVALIVCDGTYLQYDGGPQFSAGARKPFNSIFVTKDPVAMDTMILQYVNEFRKAKRKRLVGKGKYALPTHIATAAGLGLGTNDPAKIKVTEKKL